MLSESQARS